MLSKFKKIFRIPSRIVSILAQLPNVMRLCSGSMKEKSYFPDEKQKSHTRILWDNVWWLIRTNEVNQYYFAYGFDRKHGVDMSSYMPFNRFCTLRDRQNRNVRFGNYVADYTCLLKDKFIFGHTVHNFGFPTPRIIALSDDGELAWAAWPEIRTLEHLLAIPDLDVFCKLVLGECADAVFSLKRVNDQLFLSGQPVSLSELLEKLRGKFIFQQRVQQHAALQALYPRAVNTIRLATARKGKTILPLSACLRAGAHGSLVDNMTVGGVVGRIDLTTGLADPIFFQKPGYGGRIRKHPDTGVVFENFSVPFFQESVRLACQLHANLYGIHSIGWDIAITEDGPTFIEGNDNWELSGHQMFEGGMKTLFLSTLPNH